MLWPSAVERVSVIITSHNEPIQLKITSASSAFPCSLKETLVHRLEYAQVLNSSLGKCEEEEVLIFTLLLIPTHILSQGSCFGIRTGSE